MFYLILNNNYNKILVLGHNSYAFVPLNGLKESIFFVNLNAK